MSEPTRGNPPRPVSRPKPAVPKLDDVAAPTAVDKMLCERCDGEMYRMHAVWRCSICGFKTDCCGW